MEDMILKNPNTRVIAMGTSRKYKDRDNTCTRCGKIVEYMTRLEQDEHEVECRKQTKL